MHLEGQQSVLAALQARRRPIEVILLKSGVHPERAQPILSLAEENAVPTKFVSPQELDSIAFSKSHGGIIALCGRKPLERIANLPEVLRGGSGWPLLLVLEGVEDAQHLGYVIRSAEALGVHAILLKKHLWDFDETSLSRCSSGAFERLPVIQLSEASELQALATQDIQLWGCLANAKRSVYEIDLNRPVALAVGGEKRGLSGKLRSICDGFLSIPMAPGSASSLSVTHAACILIAEAARQRMRPPNPD